MLNAVDLSLYLVLDPELCGGPAAMVQTARLAAENGATVVQLRAPDWKKRQWLETAIELKAALAPFGVPLIINDHVDIALAVDADGVHVGQDDLTVAETRRLIGPDKVLGLSVSNAAELAAVPAGVAAFSELVVAASLPVVAIGGINAGNLAPLYAAGTQGVAVVSAICGQVDPAGATALLAGTIRQCWLE